MCRGRQGAHVRGDELREHDNNDDDDDIGMDSADVEMDGDIDEFGRKSEESSDEGLMWFDVGFALGQRLLL